MNTCIIVPSVRIFENWKKYQENFDKYGHNPDVIVIDEEDGKIRDENKKIIPNAEFYGRKEREQWFKDRRLGEYLSVIPKRCHAETSFGLLVAYEREKERKYDMVIFIDDDTFPLPDRDFDFIGLHHKNLYKGIIDTVTSDGTNGNWINVLDNKRFYPRGFPYSMRQSSMKSDIRINDILKGRNVLSQGLWQGVPDLNAIDILYEGHLDGRIFFDDAISLLNQSLRVGKDNYVTVCSMNLAFRPEIIPAFYQLPMNNSDKVFGYVIDRYDDIWSGIFIKKIIDHLGKYMTFGLPLCYHDKCERWIFKDIGVELNGMEINEMLWKTVDSIELGENSKDCKDYLGCYRELALGIIRSVDSSYKYRDYIEFLGNSMLKWTELVEKIR